MSACHAFIPWANTPLRRIVARIMTLFWCFIERCISVRWWIDHSDDWRGDVFIYVNSQVYGWYERKEGRA